MKQAPVYHNRGKNITLAMAHMPVAHCISEDRAQSRGVAKDICNVLPENRRVAFVPAGFVSVTRKAPYVVYNLVTKQKYHGKPTYASMFSCLRELRKVLVHDSVSMLAIPELGCGLDLLEWSKVFPMIKAALSGLKIDVYVYKM